MTLDKETLTTLQLKRRSWMLGFVATQSRTQSTNTYTHKPKIEN